jgi:hypothetical protein
MAELMRCQAPPTRHNRSIPHWLEALEPLEHVEDLRRRDFPGRSSESIAALRAAGGDDEAGALQAFQDLTHRRAGQTGTLRKLGGGAMARRLLCQVGEHDGRVIG